MSRPLRSYLLGCSVAALAAGVGSSAFADCLPNPPASGPVTCSGTTVGGLTVTTPAVVTVTSGAQLQAGAGDAAAFTATSAAGGYYYTSMPSLVVDGTVDGGGAYGVLATPGLGSGYPNTQLTLRVGAGGVIRGATAIRLSPTSGVLYGRVMVSLDNAGSITSTSGAALVAANSELGGFSLVNNRAGGYIGGVNAVVEDLINAGTIDGGAGSAYAYAASNSFGAFPDTVVNTGVMRSNGSAATLDLPTYPTITNSGRIANAGSGLAIRVGGSRLVNEAGGVIASAGAIAISGGSLSLTNRGLITGSVVTTGAVGSTSTIDVVGGTIDGDLLLGAGDDTLISAWDSTAGKLVGVTGRIDGGGGTNTLRLGFAEDVVLNTVLDQVALPSNFQRLQAVLSEGAVATLTGDVADGQRIDGWGEVISNGSITARGTALYLGQTFATSSSLAATNNGDISSTFPPPASDPYAEAALVLGSVTKFTNTGTITSTGGSGVYGSLGYSSSIFDNSGSIIATNTGLKVTFGQITNSGLIRSTAGVGVTAFSASLDNSGVIEGALAGVADVSEIVNSGTISSTNGVGVDPDNLVDNRAGGVISGVRSIAWRDGGIWDVTILNAGTLNGDVYLRSFGDYYSSHAYYDKGGTLNGSLTFGEGYDYLLVDLARFVDGRFTGITGTVDMGGGSGMDTLLLNIAENATSTVALPNTFEALAFNLQGGAEGVITVSSPLTRTLGVTGAGKLDLTADIATTNSYLISFSSRSVDNPRTYAVAEAVSLISRGNLTVTQSSAYYAADGVVLQQGSSFENAGTLTVKGYAGGYSNPTAVRGSGDVVNSGLISLSNAVGISDTFGLFTNTGTLKQAQGGGVSIGVRNVSSVINSGEISVQGQAVGLYTFTSEPVTVENSGKIVSTGDTAIQASYAALSVNNTASGLISGATFAIKGGWGSDTITNDGEIIGDINLDGGSDTVTNRGTITGDIVQGYGDGKVDNYGTITGDVSLGDGNDSFIQRVGSVVTGVVDGGYGLDTLTLDSTDGGSVSSSQFRNFELFSQVGGGSLTYSGAFTAGPIRINGGGAIVAAGTSVSAPGPFTFAGSAASETITIAGAISGGVSLGDGADAVINTGAIGGAVVLGAGDDTYTEGSGASVVGLIDGGAGSDTYIVQLSGDRVGLNRHSGFEILGVSGAGTLTLALDQTWAGVALQGSNLDLTAGAFTVGRIGGGDTAEAVRLSGDVASVELGGGDDRLTLAGAQFAGAYVGGSGADVLSFETAVPVTITGSVTGFETIALAGSELSVAGVLGATGDSAQFGDGGQTLNILTGGSVAGTIDLGAGDDVFRMAAGGTLAGTILGGAGSDLAAIDLTSDLTLRGDQLQQFETLEVSGTGALNFTGGAAKFDRVLTSSRNLTVEAGSSVTAGSLQLDAAANTVTVGGAFSGQLDLGAGDDVLRLTQGGTLAGSAAGGAGSDRLELALGGTEAAPVSLGGAAFTGFETLSLQSGVVSVSSDYGFQQIVVGGGRLIGASGSRLSGAVTVAQGATFGSAGTVVGDVLVSGTLSPGASPGTMTIDGNLALAAGSTALFELTPTISDKLVVSGAVTIAQGSTLKLTGVAALTPGRRLDLIVADGGITGGFSTIDGAQGLNLHLAQSATRLQALALFTTGTGFSREVAGTVGLLNSALVANQVDAALVDAFPALADANGASDPAALARLTPQPYASALQLAGENGLSIVDAAREQSRFAPKARGLFAFGQAIGGSRTLDGDAAAGVASGKITGGGVFSGVGYGLETAWAGAFVGYLDGRQRLDGLDARTSLDSFVVGVTGQARFGKLALAGALAHDRADADTSRAAPGGAKAIGDYKLKTWTADLNLTYPMVLNGDWSVQPRLGASYVRTEHGQVAERGGGAFALTVDAPETSNWFVDGRVELVGGQAAGARLHPYVSIGFRTRAGGDEATALARLRGLVPSLSASGLQRDGTLGSVGGGAAYDLTPSLSVSATYAGEFGEGARQAGLVGLKWSF